MPPEKQSPLLSAIGPGIITGASDDDPSGIATYSQVGAQFGTSVLWMALFSFPLMVSMQEISARIGRVTGHGIAGNVRRHSHPWLLVSIVTLLLFANILNLGADLAAMGAAVNLLIGGPSLFYVFFLGFVSLLLEIILPYSQYVHLLKWLTFALFAYVGTVFAVHIPWLTVLRDTVIPSATFSKEYLTSFIAVMGTTISPYLFFWQASEEVEEIQKNNGKSLKTRPMLAKSELRRIRIDTVVGMAFSNIITFFIILTSAVTLHSHGVTNIGSADDAARALLPIAGRFAFLLFACGIIGTGMLAIPVLAGSAAYACGEALKWRVGLEYQWWQAKGFYAIMSVAVIFGILFNLLRIDPIQSLFWVAVINGIISVPLMFVMMLLSCRKKVMGNFTLPLSLRIGGWITTIVMGLAVIGMAVLSFVG